MTRLIAIAAAVVALTVGCGAAVQDDSPSTGTTSDPPAGEVTEATEWAG